MDSKEIKNEWIHEIIRLRINNSSELGSMNEDNSDSSHDHRSRHNQVVQNPYFENIRNNEAEISIREFHILKERKEMKIIISDLKRKKSLKMVLIGLCIIGIVFLTCASVYQNLKNKNYSLIISFLCISGFISWIFQIVAVFL